MKLLLAMALALAQPVATASPSGVTPAQQGWWTVANPGNPLPSVPAPPDVPAGDLLVEGGSSASQPVAVSALVYFLPPDSSAQSLVFKVAGASLSTPGAPIELCPLTSASIVPEQGGPMADAPTYDCQHAVSAKPAATTYKVDVSTLASGGALAVAVLTTSPAARVVLAKPFLLQVAPDVSVPPATLPSLPASSPSNPTTPVSTALPAPASGPTVSPESAAPAPVAAASGPAPQLAPAQSVTTTVPAGRRVAVPAVAQAGSVRPSSNGARAFATGAAILAVVAALSLWLIAGRRNAGPGSGLHVEDHLADGPPVGDVA
jgi:hypothetical protein